MTRLPISPDLLMSEAGRRMMADELATIQAHWSELRLSAEMTAVHETRKALRRTFTLFKLFTPYFAPGVLEPHRVGLRKIMRRLAPCRDTVVFRMGLASYNETASRPLTGMVGYWGERQAIFDANLREYLDRKPTFASLDRFGKLTATEGAGLPESGGKSAPVLVRHALPAVVFQLMGSLRAYGDILPLASMEQIHQLRIQFKELRYTLSFFDDVLTDQARETIDLSRQMQEHLGALNDAAVAVEYLDRMEQHREEAAVYRGFQRAIITRLIGEIPALYAGFDRPELRRSLALAVTGL